VVIVLFWFDNDFYYVTNNLDKAWQKYSPRLEIYY